MEVSMEKFSADEQMIDRSQVAAMLNVPKRFVSERLEKMATFPKPCIKLSTKLVRWSRTDICNWLELERNRAKR
jgi:predicted DNA-binding transcriptional regulator AlpA